MSNERAALSVLGSQAAAVIDQPYAAQRDAAARAQRIARLACSERDRRRAGADDATTRSWTGRRGSPGPVGKIGPTSTRRSQRSTSTSDIGQKVTANHRSKSHSPPASSRSAIRIAAPRPTWSPVAELANFPWQALIVLRVGLVPAPGPAERYAMGPDSEVEVVTTEDGALVRPVVHAGQGSRLVARLRDRADGDMGADEVLRLTRGDDG